MLSSISSVVQVGLLIGIAIIMLVGKSPTTTIVPDYTKTLQNLEVLIVKKIDSLNVAITHLNERIETNKKNEVVIIDNRKNITYDKIKALTHIDSSLTFKQLDSDISELFPR